MNIGNIPQDIPTENGGQPEKKGSGTGIILFLLAVGIIAFIKVISDNPKTLSYNDI